MKFLILQTAFIGDVVLATPLVEKISRFFPDARIDFLLRKGNEKLLAGHPRIGQVLIWDKKGEKYKGLYRLLRLLRRERYDWVINCQRFAASGILTALSGARHTAGFDKNPFSFAFDVRAPHRFGSDASPLHEVERNLGLIAHLSDDTFVRPRLYPAAADEAVAAQWGGGGRYVCIAPTSVWFTKQFPEHKWAELMRRLPADCRIFLLGGKDDAAACERIAAASGRSDVLNLAGRLSFLESAALMRDAAMNYANDSAPVHIASAVDAPVTAVFCSTVPAFGFGPLSTRSHIVQTPQDLECRPCGLHGHRTCPRGHFRCAEDIPVEAFPVP
jgi:heptosyltransferase-2